jgi:SprT protein
MKIVTSKPTLVYGTEHTTKVTEKLQKYMELAKQLGYNEPMPLIAYSLRGRMAGRAWLAQNLIQLNPVLMVENFDDFLETTVGHEFAHLVAWKIYRDKGHGYWWRHVMWKFGIEPNRCHSYDTSTVGNNMRYYIYKCQCSSYNMATRSHNLIIKGRVYRCRFCKEAIQFTGKLTTKAEVAEQKAQ